MRKVWEKMDKETQPILYLNLIYSQITQNYNTTKTCYSKRFLKLHTLADVEELKQLFDIMQKVTAHLSSFWTFVISTNTTVN